LVLVGHKELLVLIQFFQLLRLQMAVDLVVTAPFLLVQQLTKMEVLVVLVVEVVPMEVMQLLAVLQHLVKETLAEEIVAVVLMVVLEVVEVQLLQETLGYLPVTVMVVLAQIGNH
jgi:hypothetical protein